MNSNGFNHIVPVVFAVNNEYAPYLHITLTSLIEHANSDTNYQIYILHTSLAKRNIERLEGLERFNIHIVCRNVAEWMKGIEIKNSVHLTVETCYRLLIPELFSEYLRVLYIDSDTLIMADVAELYRSELHGKTIGAIHDVVCTYLKDYYEKHINMDVKNGFNAGILVIDTYKFRENKIKEKCIQWLVEDSKSNERKYIYMDQDVLNLALSNDVSFLDSAWNFQWQYLWRLDTIYPGYVEKYIKDSKNAKIIHYAGDKKPWMRPDLEKSDLFWMIARKSIYYEEILFANLREERKNDLFKNHIFPFPEIKQDSKIILYGAGDVGTTLYKQNEVTGYVNILLWVDRDPEKAHMKNIQIYNVGALIRFPVIYDYILIAIDDTRICNEVKECLVKQGLPAEKIVWFQYRRKG